MLRLLLASFLLLFSSAAFATPYELSYGGRLAEASGKPVVGPVNLRVTFFRSLTGNDQVAIVIPDMTNVVLQEGVFQINLSLTPADFHTAFNGTDATYIQIEDLSHGVVYPRQKFAAVPYALKVPVDGQSITYDANGKLTLGATGGGAGKFLKFDSPGVLVWDNIPGGGDMLKSNNLSDLASAATARTNLGLGAAATKNVGTTAADVASGNHTHASSDVSGLGSLATKNAVGSADITDGSVTGSDIASGTITDANINATANISYLKISGLGSAASKNVGTAAGEVAAGNHTHASSDVSGLGALAAKSAVGSSDITDGSIADADVSASAAIAGSKINPNFGSQNVSTTGNATAAIVQANSNLKLKSDNANTVTLQSPTGLGAGYTLTLPVDDGSSNGQVLTTDGSGTLSWSTVSGGGGDMLKADNLSGLGNTATARTNLGLGALATKSAVGSADITDGTVSGSDIASGTITDANISASAAIDSSKISGLGSLAAKSAVGSSDITDGSITSTDIADGTITDADINATANISYLKISGLGSAASKNVGTAAGEVAAGNHTHTMSAVTDAGALATKNSVGTSDVTDGSITLAKLSATMCGANQILKMNGAGTALTCAADAGGGTYSAKSADYTVTTSDNDKLLDVTNQSTITLPAAATAGAGFRLTVKRSGSELVRIMPNGTENIDGQNVGVTLVTTNTSVTLLSSGSGWVIAGKDGIYVRSSTFADFTCGGSSDYCYDDATAKALGYAFTPGGKALEYVSNPTGFKVWKEFGGSRILKPNGSDNWAMKLNTTGKGFSATDFSNWNDIEGRVCPPNVYLDDTSKFTTTNCLYYTLEPSQALNANGADGINGLSTWSTTKWYNGNISVCSAKGMRLPTIYETSTTTTSNTYYPTADGNPTFAQSAGIPSTASTWTASVWTANSSYYWMWANTTSSYDAVTGAHNVRCVLP